MNLIQKIHMEETAKRFYNDEQALRAVIELAFFTYRDHFIKMEELDSGVSEELQTEIEKDGVVIYEKGR